MTPQELKNSILQQAIQGKLVEQRPEEGTAETLYQQIQQEKQRLCQEGKIKKEKPLPEITEEEIPFDIPESWQWVRLGQIYNLIMGQSPDGNSVSEQSNGMEFHQGKVFFGEDYIQPSNQKTIAPKKIALPNSVLLCVRAPVGVVNITERELCIGRGLCDVIPLSGMTAKYTLYSLRCLKDTFIKKATGTTFVAITGEVVKNQVIPLPPLEEQKRIVAKIEELLPLIDRYDAAWSRLEAFNKRFPDDMKKSLLQEAIQGKLVEQRPEEGTGEALYQQIQEEKARLIAEKKIKKDKPLPEITEEEIPFDIPDSWRWVRLIDVIKEKPSNGYSPKGVDFKTPVKNLTLSATTSGVFNPEKFKYVDIEIDDSSKYWLKKNDILIQRSNSRDLVGTSCIYDGNDNAFIYPDLMMRLRTTNNVDIHYIDYVLKSPMIRDYFSRSASGTSESMPKINQGIVSRALIPLPPLEEQKRIVAKLEELLPLCERLK